jgi:hypothetical protein
MRIVKASLWLVVLLTIAATAAPPAEADWISRNDATLGAFFTGPITFTLAGGRMERCNESRGTWHLKDGSGNPTLRGGRLDLTFESYLNCNVQGMMTWQYNQGNVIPFRFSANLDSVPVLEPVSGCEITLPEESGLEKLTMRNQDKTVAAEVELSGIQDKVSGTCEKEGYTGKELQMKTTETLEEIELEGPGPFWHRRSVSKGEGEKIEPASPENLSGKGGEQKLTGTIVSMPVEISSSNTQVKSSIFNNALQGQIKEEVAYGQVSLLKPVLKECTVVLNKNNIVQLKGHLAWKWNGTTKQLEEQPVATGQTPDVIYTPVEPTEQTPFTTLDYRKGGALASVTFKGTGCGAFAGLTISLEGSQVGIPNRSLEEWGRTLAVRTIPSGSLPKEVGEKEGFMQHFWAGERFQGLIAGLTFSSSPANLIGQTEAESAKQEIAIFEH